VAKEKNAGVKGTCAHAHKCFGDNIYHFKSYLDFCGGAPHWEKSKFATARSLYLTVAANFVKNGTTFGEFMENNPGFASTNFSATQVYKFEQARAPTAKAKSKAARN
jgi:hypothetical protein